MLESLWDTQDMKHRQFSQPSALETEWNHDGMVRQSMACVAAAMDVSGSSQKPRDKEGPSSHPVP
jgi:hypothetical protein